MLIRTNQVLTDREVEIQQYDKVKHYQMDILKVYVDILVVHVHNIVNMAVVHVAQCLREYTL